MATHIYERLTIGLGDGIMLRPAIIANIQKYPYDRHILHGHISILPIFKDITGLETKAFADYRYSVRKVKSTLLIKRYYPDAIIYELSRVCAEYETLNAPVKVEKRKFKLTGEQILLSRQELWCDTVGVSFNMDNYKVQFFKEEQDFARAMLDEFRDYIVIHAESNDKKRRDYTKMHFLIEYVAKKWDGWILTIGKDYQYKGLMRNIYSINNRDIRKIWCMISKSKLLIGIDSFGVHAAGSTGINTYGIFGSTDPECRLLYPKAFYSDPYDRCQWQYCWYQTCVERPCINRRSPKYYWEDICRKVNL